MAEVSVRVEDRLTTSVDEVWLAPRIRAALPWLGEVEGDLRLGGEFSARFHASGWEGTGRVEVCDPPQRLRVATKGADQPDSEPHRGHSDG